MKNTFVSLKVFVSIALISLTGCTFKILEVEFEDVKTIYDKTKIEDSLLERKTTLYLDHSTSIIDAVKNSKVWNALFPNFTQYSDELVLIKGSEFERIELDSNNNKVEEALKRIDVDIAWADIEKAVQEICKGNNQAILVSDFEAFDKSSGSLEKRTQDLVPYLSPWLKMWLEKGFSVYIIAEPYIENYKGKVWNKKRFYFVFSDDRLEAPISSNIKSQLGSLSQDGTFTLYKMTNSDIKVQSPKSDMSDNALDFSVDYGKGFDFISIESSWNDIREYVMKLDNYGESIPEEDKQPILRNFSFNNGENYKIENIKILATNITSNFIDDNQGFQDKDISDAFIVDDNALNSNKLNVYLTDKIFTDGYLSSDLGGNLIRMDFIIDEVSIKSYDNTIFEWPSLHKNQTAICVSKSIENALLDLNVIPTNDRRKIIHTVFLKTATY
jgi:hypothetical protein